MTLLLVQMVIILPLKNFQSVAALASIAALACSAALASVAALASIAALASVANVSRTMSLQDYSRLAI